MALVPPLAASISGIAGSGRHPVGTGVWHGHPPGASFCQGWPQAAPLVPSGPVPVGDG